MNITCTDIQECPTKPIVKIEKPTLPWWPWILIVLIPFIAALFFLKAGAAADSNFFEKALKSGKKDYFKFFGVFSMVQKTYEHTNKMISDYELEEKKKIIKEGKKFDEKSLFTAGLKDKLKRKELDEKEMAKARLLAKELSLDLDTSQTIILAKKVGYKYICTTRKILDESKLKYDILKHDDRFKHAVRARVQDKRLAGFEFILI
jgi:hypothetical protein